MIMTDQDQVKFLMNFHIYILIVSKNNYIIYIPIGWVSYQRLVDQFYSSQLAIIIEIKFRRRIHHAYC